MISLEIEDRLKQILDGFAKNPQAAQKALREMLASDGGKFRAGALSVLKRETNSAGREFLVGMLAEKDFLIDPLCDPAFFSSPEAISIARLAARARPQLDLEMARRLPELARTALSKVRRSVPARQATGPDSGSIPSGFCQPSQPV